MEKLYLIYFHFFRAHLNSGDSIHEPFIVKNVNDGDLKMIVLIACYFKGTIFRLYEKGGLQYHLQ